MSRWRYALTVATLVATIVALEALVGHGVPLRVPLSALPFQLSNWRGHAEPIDSATRERTHPDDLINRRYTDTTGNTVMLYVAYYQRDASRAQLLDVCGTCEILSRGVQVIEIDGAPLTVNRVMIREDGLDSLVLYWFQSAGGAYHDPRQGKLNQALRVFRTRRSEGALIRITTPLVGTDQETGIRAVAFVKAVFPPLRAHFQN